MTSNCLYLYRALWLDEPAGADVQLYFLYALHQVVFHCRSFLSWCPLHCPITIGRLQGSSIVQPCAMECLPIECQTSSHQLPHATNVWWRHFGWTVLHDEELSNHSYPHPQAFLLSTIDQPLWRHHSSLHQRSFEQVAHQFLGMKKDCMQIKAKQFDFCKTHFHEFYFNSVWTFAQVKSKWFWLEINWTKTILQEVWHRNIVFIKQSWTEWKLAFCEINF